MRKSLESQLEVLLRAAASDLLGAPWEGPVPVEVSNRPDLGDYASPVAFHVARHAGTTPLEAAKTLATTLVANPDSTDLVESAVAVAPAFVNVRIASAGLESVIRTVYALAGSVADDKDGVGV